ncbi:MAG: CCA tRNA nucleotidyltransferase [Hespellia sp.]|nr:CCA tRNA nucleotidyltransferase [Hespellia sp.]
MKITLPDKVVTIINNLQLHGYEAYVVGGCVRDSILGRVPEDWDITTSATPDEVKELFQKTVDTGIEHGTVTVLIGGEGFEITTYRIDGEYEDSRHPKDVEFTRNLKDDLLRRDFTINAMAYNDSDRLIDIFGGMKDLSAHVIRCVGNPMDRLSEDALRILRAIRFSAQLDFPMEQETAEAIRVLTPKLADISAERIQVELVKLLTSPHPERIQDMYELGITKLILPEWDNMVGVEQNTKHHQYNVDVHTIEAMKNVRADKVLRLTMMFHDMGKPEMRKTDSMGIDHFKAHALVSEEIARKVLRRLKFDNDTVKKVTHLVCYHDYRVASTPKNLRRAMRKLGEDLFPLYLEVRMADILAQSTYDREAKVKNIEEMRELYEQAKLQNVCVSLKKMAVTGTDLLELGMEPGREMGQMLNKLLDLVTDFPEFNTKEALLAEAKKMLK